jgi:hypothetical protein
MIRRSHRAAHPAIVAPVVLVLLLPLLAGACASSDTPAESASSSPKASSSPSPTTVKAPSAAKLYADLRKAIRTADPSLSPDDLDAHICAVTAAPFSIIVVPYDPTASNVEEVQKVTVAFSGLDGALGEDFDEFLYRSRGRRFYATRMAGGYGARLVLAGHHVTVGGRDGYVLIATPAQ